MDKIRAAKSKRNWDRRKSEGGDYKSRNRHGIDIIHKKRQITNIIEFFGVHFLWFAGQKTSFRHRECVLAFLIQIIHVRPVIIVFIAKTGFRQLMRTIEIIAGSLRQETEIIFQMHDAIYDKY